MFLEIVDLLYTTSVLCRIGSLDIIYKNRLEIKHDQKIRKSCLIYAILEYRILSSVYSVL
jgi:hypothetical protein